MKNAFRTLVIAQVVLWLASAYVIPNSMREVQREFHIPSSFFYGSSLFGNSLQFLFYLQVLATLSMLAFWNATRHIYTVLIVAGMALLTLNHAMVRSGVRDAINGADGIMTGVILAMIYFSPLREVFAGSQPPQQFAAAAAPPFPPPPLREQSEMFAPAPPPSVQPQICAFCGAAGQDSRFCTQCGLAVAGPPACVRCGAALVPGERFCRQCGGRM
jgi:hypothetical protein